MISAIKIIAIDSLAGILAGCFVVLLSPFLTSWYGWSESFTYYIGIVNICYGCYSGSLALFLHKKLMIKRWLILFLIIANSLWAIQCLYQIWRLVETSTAWGQAHLLFEAVFVSVLAYIEMKVVLPQAKN